MAQRLPRPVSLASYLLIALAAVALTDVVVSAVGLIRLDDAGPRFLASGLAQQVADPQLVVETVEQDLRWHAVIAAAMLVAFGVLGLLIRRPYAIARNLVWIVGSVALFVLSCAVTVNSDYTAPTDGMQRWWALTELGLLPAWHPGVRSVLTTAELALLILGCLQLLRQDAMDHYRMQTVELSLSTVLARRQERIEREGA
ncbi:hypothetical protein [Catellatospora paridis]|uniref:hypothetical protein n=1 Tax=Catellatospora paridis TaxID=1617086 RepID=UPI0012D41EEA|nr:hypothetical protein [Catellatospora paridis]